MGDLDKVMIAGQFGAHLPAEIAGGDRDSAGGSKRTKLIYVGKFF